jgi:hypothetical protein
LGGALYGGWSIYGRTLRGYIIIEMEFDEVMVEQMRMAEAVMRKKEPKVNKKGRFFDSATHEMQKPRKTSEGSSEVGSKEEEGERGERK